VGGKTGFEVNYADGEAVEILDFATDKAGCVFLEVCLLVAEEDELADARVAPECTIVVTSSQRTKDAVLRRVCIAIVDAREVCRSIGLSLKNISYSLTMLHIWGVIAGACTPVSTGPSRVGRGIRAPLAPPRPPL
jgi:hypothetical protein